MSKMLEDFRKFVMRGNVLDLAVAVVIGVAFNAVVNSLVNDVIMQVIAAIFGKANFDTLDVDGQRRRHLLRQVPHRARELPHRRRDAFVVIKAFEEMQKRRKNVGRGDPRGRAERRSRPPHRDP